MCGIAGIFGSGAPVQQEVVERMTNVIAHRGPDGWHVVTDAQHNVAFGHRRLSIIDLTENGAQPMWYDNGRYLITFNGEIYNYIELREKLRAQGLVFHTESDTEVLLAAYSLLKTKCLEELNGMFAFAIWDKETGEVFMARDRFGEKPLYYAFKDGNVYFASEMKALFAAGISKQPNEERYFKYLSGHRINNADDGTTTYYQQVSELPSASYMVFRNGKMAEEGQYWSLDHIKVDKNIRIEEAVSRFREIFIDSVKIRMRSDVAVGTSLSGGIDSSTIVTLVQQIIGENQKQKTFSARFNDFKRDEGKYIDLVLSRCNKIKGYYTYPTVDKLQQEIDTLSYHLEEPFRSGSQYNQYCVMRLAKQQNVTVLLDGQGADEMLAGYLHYYFHYLTSLITHRPFFFAKEYVSYQKLQKQYEPYRIPRRIPLWLSQKWFQNKPYVFDTDVRELLKTDMTKTHLKELLRYGDRNSMAFSREVRLPFLDHRLVELVFSLPTELILHNGWTKYVLRKSFQDIVPNEISWRIDKVGFEPPQQQWMQALKPAIDAYKQKHSYLDITGGREVATPIDDWKWLMLKQFVD